MRSSGQGQSQKRWGRTKCCAIEIEEIRSGHVLQDWGLLAKGWAIRDEIEAKEYEAEICAMRSRAMSIRPR